MEPDTSPNGQLPRVRFGPLPTQTIPQEWAERLLTRFAHENRTKFGEWLRAIVIAELVGQGDR
jgi:hypothetical protein